MAFTRMNASWPSWLQRYADLPRGILWLALGQFLLNLIHTAHFLLLNLFLRAHELDDPTIAALSSQRFVATFFLALPAGLWLRGRKLRRPLVISALLFPLTALASLFAVEWGAMQAANLCFLLMGLAALLLNVGSIPMALRIVRADQASECLSLLFATWAAASIVGGLLAACLQSIGTFSWGDIQLVFDEMSTLVILTCAGLGAAFFYAKLPDPAPEAHAPGRWFQIHREDYPKLWRTLVPSIIIATGAGLSIQFLNLFFHSVHGVRSSQYSLFGTISNVLVLTAGIFVPAIKRRFGWHGAIIGVQSAAVALLVLMGLTELMRAHAWALPLAAVCFMLRQPLMSMAGPAISELTMNYVGDRNRELVSACNGAVWSGAWWLAARLFQLLRSFEIPYWLIFLTTALLYLVGTLSYRRMIRHLGAEDEERKNADSGAL